MLTPAAFAWAQALQQELEGFCGPTRRLALMLKPRPLPELLVAARYFNINVLRYPQVGGDPLPLGYKASCSCLLTYTVTHARMSQSNPLPCSHSLSGLSTPTSATT